MGGLRVGIGASAVTDAGTAGRNAASDALRELGTETPALVMVYASVSLDLPVLLAGIREVFPGVPLVGATSSGQFHRGELTQPGAGVSVLAITAGRYRFGVASITGISEDGFEAGRALATWARAAIPGTHRPHAAVLLLSDGLAVHHQTLLNGVHRVTGAPVPVVGGAAGDDRKLHQTFVFRDDKVLTDAAVAVWIEAPKPLRVVHGHGWRAEGLPLLITAVDGPVVHEVAGRPAVEVFREHFRDDHIDSIFGAVRKPGYHSAHAFGLIQPDGSLLVRGAFLDDNGAIRTFAPLPPYSAVQIVSCGPDDLLRTSTDVIERGLDGDDEASVMLAFSCVARLDILAERAGEEAERLQDAADQVPTFGFYTYGEFARTGSVTGYHNATVTALAL